MDNIVMASIRRTAGKTSMIIGIAKAAGKSVGYMKPFGDRMKYSKKRLWDSDAMLLTSLFDLENEPEDLTLGFDHAKLHYMYTEDLMRKKLREEADKLGKGKEVLFIEGGKDVAHGISVHLDALSIARALKSKLIFIVSGPDDAILDDVTFIKKHLDLTDIDFRGVIVNKAPTPEDFKNSYARMIADMGIQLLGVIPYKTQLASLSIEQLAEALFAKIIGGKNGLKNIVENIFIGALSGDAALRHPLFHKEHKLIITGGDRCDMILAALATNTSGIILTNDIMPPANIISQADEHNVPLLLVPSDTYAVVQQVYGIEPLLTKNQTENIALLEQLVKKRVDIDAILKK